MSKERTREGGGTKITSSSSSVAKGFYLQTLLDQDLLIPGLSLLFQVLQTKREEREGEGGTLSKKETVTFSKVPAFFGFIIIIIITNGPEITERERD